LNVRTRKWIFWASLLMPFVASASVNTNHWPLFEPVERPEIPQRTAWVRNPVDAFIARKHREKNLTPRPEAPKHILLRRVYLDLIGLTPTPEEQRAFLDDPSPEAYEKVVDRLLEDPRHGERWGRHWMDVWRYSDWAGWSGGNQIRDSKPHIWRWKDWIIESLNADKPYDRMLIEMLAADELAPEDTNVVRATGFLVRNYKMLSREQWLEDTIKHTSQAFLGVTMGCAKCHDHMTDPISQDEYYRVRSIFEPHQVRTDRVPGETDLLKAGLVRAYDTDTNALTFFFNRGDERKPDTNRVMRPGVPAALNRGQTELEIDPVSLPFYVANPDRRLFVIGDTLAASDQAIKDARKDDLKLAVAEAKHAALLAVLSIESLEKGSAEWKAGAEKVCMAQRKQKLAEAKLAVREAEANTKKEPTADAAKKAAQAYKSLYDAEEKLAEPPSTEFKARSEDNYPAKSTGRRLAFARWVASPENPLTARVAVNHIWLRHFGRGIVATPENFGRTGSRPSHPELLDWLAAEFMARGWSMKAIHRLILTSSAYRMASTPDERNAAIDPDNVYLWRMPSRRMEAELIRDNVLHVSGSLDSAMGGPDIDHAAGLTSRRRSVYLRIAAEKEVEFLTVFDGPTATECYQRRPTVLPQQALALANSELGFAQSRLLAEHLPGDESFIPAAFERILARVPTPEELSLCSEFLKDEKSRQNLVLVLFNHTDFVTIR
jgi:uncharacterized protein DUF1553/uncharacterized protein DUF1549